MDETGRKTKLRIALVGFALFLVFVIGLFWYATSPEITVGLTLSFVSGLSMIFLPCTLPLAFVIVPLTLGKEPKKGFLMALSFAIGLTITLSFYGIFIAALGKTFGLKADVEVWAVLIGGIAAFTLGLSEIGLLNFKLPAYSGKFPDFIQRRQDYVKTFLLGLFLGNAGVGCPNPAFYLLLGYIATTADLFNGWILGFVHGLGRSVPLIFLAILGTLGINALSGVIKHKEKVERAMGWALIIIGAYLLTFGIFGHDWFVSSGIHSGWESFVYSIGGERFGETILQHEHKLVDVPNFINYGNLFFLGLLALTFIVAFALKRPKKRTIVTLLLIYALLFLLIGYTTGWTFKTSPSIHIEFRGETGSQAHIETLYHEEREIKEGLVVNLNLTPFPARVEFPAKLDFLVNKKPGNVPIKDLEIDHGKLMHVIAVRSDLEEFFHIHPEREGESSLFSILHIFRKPGLYKVWSEVKQGGVVHAFGHPEFMVEGEGEKFKKEIFFGTSQVVGNYTVVLHKDALYKGFGSNLHFEIHDNVGREVELEPYLESDMHLTIIKDDWNQFIHTHPQEHADGHTKFLWQLIAPALANGGHVTAEPEHGVSFNVIFPEAGLYRAFAQFRPKGINLPPDEALLTSFWLEVKQEAPFSISSWWINLIWSLIAILILSWAVKRYITVK
ncbi:MAG: disulfide bond oxidoreductase D family protein [Parcubacteria group bacterium Gr01-1014_30]|nr:MAG: disulfide bond oxidoreductase D family protein [Parcubacteria group bacterium Gr01-1014_30]